MKTFNTLSQQECQKVFPEIYLSANDKWKSTNYLSKKEDYATATFLMITCIEEYLKSLILALDGNGFKFRQIKGFDGVFKNHSLRYPIIYLFHFMAASFEFSETFKLKKGVIRKAWYTLNRLIDTKTNFKWYSNLDNLRENSLYSNFTDQLILPNEINKIEFEKVKENLTKVRFAFCSIIVVLNPENDRFKSEKVEFIDTVNKMVNDFGLYDSLDEQLSLIRKGKPNSNHLRTITQLFINDFGK
jgi:AbiV family abortive infection protein